MNAPDLTNTAPKRIYLDIGDQFALERVASGDLRWDLLDGVTWSEDNATSHGIPYVRADLVPTPAASGAAPAEFEPWLRTICITAPPPQAYDLAKQAWAQGMKRGAALASREASGAALKDDGSTPGPWRVEKRERDGELAACWIAAPDCNGFAYAAEILGDDEYRDGADAKANGMSRLVADCELIVKAVAAYRAALASPQVAPALTDMMKVWGMSAADLEAGPDRTSMDHYNKGVAAGIRQCIADCTRLAAPVQVAPTAIASKSKCKTCGGTGVVDDGEIDCYEGGMPYENGPVKCVKDCPACATRAPIAPQDDARDAAEAKAIRAVQFHLVSEKLPELVNFSDNYGGNWSSEWCVALTESGECRVEKFRVSGSTKDAIEAGEFSRYRLWELTGSRLAVFAWAYQKDVAAALSTPAAKPTEEQGS